MLHIHNVVLNVFILSVHLTNLAQATVLEQLCISCTDIYGNVVTFMMQ